MALGNNPKQNEVVKAVKDLESGKQNALPTTTTAGQVLKSTSTAGTLEWGSIPSGTPTDVQINGTSITSGGVANIVTNTAYNASSNKVATMSDVPTLSAGTNITINNQVISVSDYEWYFFNSSYTSGYVKFVTISTAVGGNDSMLNFIVNRSGNNQEIFSGIATIKLRYGGEVQYQSPARCSIQWLSRTDGFNCDDIVGVDNGNRTVSFYIKTDLRQACSFKVLQFSYSSATTGTAGNYSTYTPITNETVATITPTYTSRDAKPSPYGTSLTSGTFSKGNDYVTETYISSNYQTWYRKWASGWKECGGTKVVTATNNGSYDIDFPIAFTQADSVTPKATIGGWYDSSYACQMGVTYKDTSKMTVQIAGSALNTIYWSAEGY